MNIYMTNRKNSLFYRAMSFVIAIGFLTNVIIPPQFVQAQVMPTVLNLPVPGTMLATTESGYVPLLIKGITVDPQNPLEFDFIVDQGHESLTQDEFKAESERLIKYFLASLTTPDDEMWVNLSPYEEDRIIPEAFGQTEMGRDLLAQDYILKQLTASLMYPENDLGKKFWQRIRQKAQEQFGTTDVPMDTFNKIWIVPEKAKVYQVGHSAFVVGNHLKVMLEEDYFAMQKNQSRVTSNELQEKDFSSPVTRHPSLSKLQSEIMREIIVPEIEKEVNEGELFANLRQVYQSTILAEWFKRNLKESILGHVYVDQKKVAGIDVEDKQIKQKIYEQYVAAMKQGVFNYIKEDFDPATKRIIPRHYFSGGTHVGLKDNPAYTEAEQGDSLTAEERDALPTDESARKLRVVLTDPEVFAGEAGERNADQAMLSDLEAVKSDIKIAETEVNPKRAFNLYLKANKTLKGISPEVISNEERLQLKSIIANGVAPYFVEFGSGNEDFLIDVIGSMSNDVVAKLHQDLRVKVVDEIGLNNLQTPGKFILYSGPPGGGKGAAWEAFTAGKNKNIVERFVLFHTRDPRPGEVPGKTYHFRSPEHLKGLADGKNKDARVVTDEVNKQLQGMALNNFSDKFEIKTKVEREDKTGKKITEEITEERTEDVVGLDGIIHGQKIGVLEGGLAWFEFLRDYYPQEYERSLFSLFVNPLTIEQLEERAKDPLTYMAAAQTAIRMHAREVKEAMLREEQILELIDKGVRHQQDEQDEVFFEAEDGKKLTFYVPTTQDDFEKRAMEAAEQMKRRHEYSVVLENPWDPENKEAQISSLTEDFAKQIFSSILIGLGYSPEEVKKMTADRMFEILEHENLNEHRLMGKFALYSGPPGGGKGAVWDELIKRYDGKIKKHVLFHTRSIRPNETQNKHYYFRTEAHLRKLATEGKIILADVNGQLQGLAVGDSFTDTDYIDPTTANGELGEPVRISGLNEVFEGSHIEVLEGGLAWFDALKKKFGNDLVSIFISPLSDQEIDAVAPGSEDAKKAVAAYEVARRIHFREIQEAKKVKDGAENKILKGEPIKEGRPKDGGDFYVSTKQADYEDRTVEGGTQIVRSGEYSAVIENPWDPEHYKEINARVGDEFSALIFNHILYSAHLDELAKQAKRERHNELNLAEYDDASTPLSSRIEKLLAQQIDARIAITFSKDGGEKLDAYYDKNIDRGPFEVQINPRRNPKNRAVVRRGKEGLCFLCSENQPLAERGILFKDGWIIYPNPSPYEKNHVVIVKDLPVDHGDTQKITTREELEAAVDIETILVKEGRDEYNVTFNSTGAAASSPHFHLQAFEYHLPLFDFAVEKVSSVNGVDVGFVKDYPTPVIVVEGKDKDAVIDQVLPILRRLNISRDKTALPKDDKLGNLVPYNLMFKVTPGDFVKVYIVPRGMEDLKNADRDDVIKTKFGIVEMGGMIIVYFSDEETGEGLYEDKEAGVFKKIDEAAVKRSIAIAGFQDRAFLEANILNDGLALDKAMLANEDAEAVGAENLEKGGIDLNPSFIEMQIKRDENDMPLPVSQQPIMNMQVDGFTPVIINISPMPNLQMLLGGADAPEEEPEQLTFNQLMYYDRIEAEELEEMAC